MSRYPSSIALYRRAALFSVHFSPGAAMHRNARPPAVAMLALALSFASAHSLFAQQPAAPATPTPEIGSMAPDFTISGATRYGLLRDSVRLSDFRGQTVVLAFFFQARTKG